MSKDPTPRADALRAQREARYGHLQATADTPAGYVEGAKASAPSVRKLIPYAGKDAGKASPPSTAPAEQTVTKINKPSASEAPFNPTKPPRKRVKYKRKIA